MITIDALLTTRECPASQFGSTLTKVPAPGTENDDKNPPRIASRNLFDQALGDDNLFKGRSLSLERAGYLHQPG
jgi:hypothetical protein